MVRSRVGVVSREVHVAFPTPKMMGLSVFAGNTRMYISEIIQKRYVVCCPEFDVENEEML